MTHFCDSSEFSSWLDAHRRPGPMHITKISAETLREAVGFVASTWAAAETVWENLEMGLPCGAPKIAKLVFNSNNYGLWYL